MSVHHVGSVRWAVALAALLVAGLLLAPAPADARRPTNQASPTRVEAVRISSEILAVRLEIAKRETSGDGDPASLLADARRLRGALAEWKDLMGRYQRQLARGRSAGSPREAALNVPTFVRTQRALAALESLGGVSGVSGEIATRTEQAKPIIAQLLDDGFLGPVVDQRLGQLGLTRLVLRPRPLAQLKTRLVEEVSSVLAAQVPSIAGVSGLDVLIGGVPPQVAARQALRRRANLILTRLVVRGNPIRGYILQLVGLDEVLAEVSDQAVRVATWPARQVVRLIRGIGRRKLTLDARARRSTQGLTGYARFMRCRIRATKGAKVDGRSCGSIRHGARFAQAQALIAQADRRVGGSARLQRDLKAAGKSALIRRHDAALAKVEAAKKQVQNAYLLESQLVLSARDNLRLACAELERLDRIIGELEKVSAPLAPTPAPPAPTSAASPSAPAPSATPGRATRASCLEPIQVDTGFDSANINPYGVVRVRDLATSVICTYERTGAPQAGVTLELRIWWTPGAAGACGQPPGDPIRASGGVRQSTRREISAALTGGGIWRLDGPAGWPEDVIRAAEAEGAGLPCA